MIERPDIDALMSGELGEWLTAQAQVRAAAREESNGRLVKAAFVVLPLAAFLLFGPGWDIEVKIWLIALAGIASGVWIYAPKAKAIRQTKEGINSALAAALGLTYSHDCEPGAGFDRAKLFRMLPGYSRAKFEDKWWGQIGTRAFTLHEAHLEQKRQSGKNSHYVTVFRGPVMTIAAGRRFHGVTLVERSGKHKKFGLFGEKDRLEISGLILDKADMVHPGFEDQFTVYSTDQVEARYLVHPGYVEKMIALEAAFSGSKIRTLFHEGEVTVVLEVRNMFESGQMDAGRDREMVAACVAQFMAMADLAASVSEADRR
ncbi:DUF3137 domain-containing protein [Alteraurantiacibacter palmitatis]|uniref:DUF3137 domain-containing protein n=1 Tax=Alteraurantiacibacter palmitatis TaxID=2054628 RepID=A0ABV7E341_9SPHN